MAERVFVLPDLGEGLEEGVVSAWLVAEGDDVELNQPIAEVETAKAVVEMPSPHAGKILRLHVDAGATVSVGAPLVTFEVADADAPAPETGAPASASSVGVTGSTAAVAAATPAVRRLAKDRGVDLGRVTGTGPDGRITREDVERAAAAVSDADEIDAEVVPISTIRAAIARRLTEVASIPQVTTFRTVDATALDAVRRELGVSPLPVFVRALAEICREHPWLNASWGGDRILLHRSVHAGIATDTERGLLVPVVRDAASSGIASIAAEIERLARAARGGSLSPADVTGATITVTNTGSYGSESGTPLLDPGHAVTVALGVIEPRALVVDGRVEARPACTVSLTFDHRVLDGATVGRAFGALVDLLGSRERLEALPR
jgi:pyruvate dehydrogenase E2 component (dihydrolipoamide acetyltransferase)